MLNERQMYILRLLVKTYIETAHPVSSQFLLERASLDVSPATVRNDFALLEVEGYVTQPHTSAGRMPTVKGYQWYVQQLSQEVEHARTYEKRMRTLMQKDVREQTRMLAAMTGETVVWVDGTGHIHYSGVSNLLSQPEFENEKLRSGVGEIFEGFDDMMHRLDERQVESLEYVVGDDKLLPSPDYGMVSLRLDKGEEQSMVVVLGPLRMNYEKATILLKLLRELHNE